MRTRQGKERAKTSPKKVLQKWLYLAHYREHLIEVWVREDAQRISEETDSP